MGAPITITIPGAPVAKGRPRIGTDMGGHACAFTPAKTRSYENLIKLAAGEAMNGGAPIDGPLNVAITVYLPIPKSWSKKKTMAAELGHEHPTSRPDVDNFIKAALDGLNKIVFGDDSQVVQLSAEKKFSPRPRLVVSIHKIMEAPAS